MRRIWASDIKNAAHSGGIARIEFGVFAENRFQIGCARAQYEERHQREFENLFKVFMSA